MPSPSGSVVPIARCGFGMAIQSQREQSFKPFNKYLCNALFAGGWGSWNRKPSGREAMQKAQTLSLPALPRGMSSSFLLTQVGKNKQICTARDSGRDSGRWRPLRARSCSTARPPHPGGPGSQGSAERLATSAQHIGGRSGAMGHHVRGSCSPGAPTTGRGARPQALQYRVVSARLSRCRRRVLSQGDILRFPEPPC